MSCVKETDAVISTTGMISSELFYHQDRLGNFYMIGSMGLLSSFGLGLAKLHPQRKFFVLDGDGSALMSMGTMALVAAEKPRNFIHIVLDNVRSAYNVGSIFRSADTAAVAEVITCGFTPHPPHPKLCALHAHGYPPPLHVNPPPLHA